MDLDNILSGYKSAVIVLGGKSARFNIRLAEALKLQKLEENCLLIISGQDIYSDERVMKMLEYNTDFEHENVSANTLDNAENSYRIVKGANGTTSDEKDTINIEDVYVLTDTLHIPRTKRYFKKTFGNEFMLYFQPIPEDKKDLPKKLIYEGVGYLVSFLPREYINIAKRIKNKYFPWI
jgi:uncharacterized SAM-binding protein YcdF (DUF218 family)